MTKASVSKKEQLVVQDQSDQGNVDNIREILFGGQMRDFDRRFTRLEERLSEENNRLRQELEGRLDSVEKFVRAELEHLRGKLQQERKERVTALKEVENNIRRLERELLEGLEQLDGNTAGELAKMRQQLHDDTAALQGQLRQRQEELLRKIEQDNAMLQQDKVGHANLADLFAEMGLRLGGKFEMPQGGE